MISKVVQLVEKAEEVKKQIMVPLSKVQDLIGKHSKLEKELSSQEIDKKSLQRSQKNTPT